jgi:thiol-disulfide isomerase/thioredoxin
MAAVAVAAAGSGYFAARALHPPVAPAPVEGTAALPSPEDLVGARRPDFQLDDLAGRQVSADDFAGKVLLVNFWASWCKPCVEEMPMLSKLHEELAGSGFSVVGIALDRPDRAAETDVVLAGRRYGNRSGMLPYSVLVGADGIIRWTHLGALARNDLESRVRALLSGPAAAEGR